VLACEDRRPTECVFTQMWRPGSCWVVVCESLRSYYEKSKSSQRSPQDRWCGFVVKCDAQAPLSVQKMKWKMSDRIEVYGPETLHHDSVLVL